MGVFNPGGGGSPAPTGVTSTTYALDKPYELSGEMTPEKLQQIDEMFAELYKGFTKARDALTTGLSSTGSGNVVGPATAVDGDIALYNGVTGKLLKDGAKLGSDLVTGPASSTDNRIALFNGVTGKILKDAGYTMASIVNGLVTGIQVEVSNAQIKALNTTPITVVPAAGANTMNFPIAVVYRSNVSVAYSSTVSITLRYAGVATDISQASIMLQTADRYVFQLLANSTAIDPSTGAVNADIVVRGGSNPTLGNAANYLRVRVYYVTIDTSLF